MRNRNCWLHTSHLIIFFGGSFLIFTESCGLASFSFFFLFLSFIWFVLWCAGIYLWNPDDFSFSFPLVLPSPGIDSWKEEEKLERSWFHQPEPDLNLLAPPEDMMPLLRGDDGAWEFDNYLRILSVSVSVSLNCSWLLFLLRISNSCCVVVVVAV